MKTLNFSIDVIEPGNPILYLCNFGIEESIVQSYEVISYSSNESSPVIKYYIYDSEGKIITIKSNVVILAADFESLIDKLEFLYYKDKPVLPRGVEQVDMLASDEDIARRTTYLCSDGKFYNIEVNTVVSTQLNISYPIFIVSTHPGINDRDFKQCEQYLFESQGCEVCRIIEDDKGRFIIEDRMCESSGFIFMSLDAAKNAAYWLMEDYNATALVEGLDVVQCDSISIPVESDEDKLHRLINNPDWVYILKDKKCVIVNHESNNSEDF